VNGFAGRRASACAFVPVSGLLPTGRPLTHPGRRLEGRRRPLRGAVRTIACTLCPGTRQHGIFFGDWLDGEELSGTKRQGDSTQHRLFKSGPDQCVDHNFRLPTIGRCNHFCDIDERHEKASSPKMLTAFFAVPQVSRN
jgi:hypothetical protein